MKTAASCQEAIDSDEVTVNYIWLYYLDQMTDLKNPEDEADILRYGPYFGGKRGQAWSVSVYSRYPHNQASSSNK